MLPNQTLPIAEQVRNFNNFLNAPGAEYRLRHTDGIPTGDRTDGRVSLHLDAREFGGDSHVKFTAQYYEPGSRSSGIKILRYEAGNLTPENIAALVTFIPTAIAERFKFPGGYLITPAQLKRRRREIRRVNDKNTLQAAQDLAKDVKQKLDSDRVNKIFAGVWNVADPERAEQTRKAWEKIEESLQVPGFAFELSAASKDLNDPNISAKDLAARAKKLSAAIENALKGSGDRASFGRGSSAYDDAGNGGFLGKNKTRKLNQDFRARKEQIAAALEKAVESLPEFINLEKPKRDRLRSELGSLAFMLTFAGVSPEIVEKAAAAAL